MVFFVGNVKFDNRLFFKIGETMNIDIDNIQISHWESGSPYWITIEHGKDRVSFTHSQLILIIKALEMVYSNLRTCMLRTPPECAEQSLKELGNL